jgi:hypothetical protein
MLSVRVPNRKGLSIQSIYYPESILHWSSFWVLVELAFLFKKILSHLWLILKDPYLAKTELANDEGTTCPFIKIT